MLLSIIVFLIIFSVIVISHEFGHFMVARRNGIRVLEFDVGFGPTIWKKKSGETEIKVGILPLGGACVFDGMLGMEDDGREPDEHSFERASVWARIATVLAGPAANFILGFVLAMIVVSFTGVDLPVVDKIIPDSAAEEAGMQAGDVIKKIDGESIHLDREISLMSMMNYGEEMTITYVRDGKDTTVTLTPRYSEEDGRYLIGLQSGGTVHKLTALEVFPYSWYECEYWLRATVKSIGLIFRGHFSKDDISGPVGIVKAVDDTRQSASPYGAGAMILSFLSLACLLTINLGVVNLLPLPAIDGGRLVFLLIEAIRGKPVPRDKEGLVHLAGMIALLALMILVLFNDISRFFR